MGNRRSKARSPFGERPTSLGRRRFVSALGAGALVGVPFLRGILSSRAAAQADAVPPRFLGVRVYHGVDRDLFIPKTTGGADPGGTDVALSDLTFNYTNAFLKDLEDWRSKITVLDGLDQWVCFELTPGHHGHEEQSTGLTGARTAADGAIRPGHPSLDVYMHGRFTSDMGYVPPVRLSAGAGDDGGGWKQISYDSNSQPINGTTNPVSLFREAFPSDFMPGGTETVDYSAAERRVYEHALSRIGRIRNELTGSERVKLEAHEDAMQRLIANLMSPPAPAECTTSGSDSPSGMSLGGYAQMEWQTDVHAQVIAQAFACGRSRCATLRIGSDWVCPQSDLPEVRALDLGSAFGGDYASTWRFHENLVHDYWQSGSHPQFARLQQGYVLGWQWQARRFRAVLEALDALPDPYDPAGGSILDNTIVYLHNEFGHGPHDNQAQYIPAIIAGGAGKLKMGRYIRLRDFGSSQRVPHNRLLTSFAQAMGFSDVGFYGDMDLAADPSSFARYHGELTEVMV
ncbi:MAG: DUF1552 domain-containing protein [Sandaracinaceae bacterium]